jgi:hypothetical protein
MCLNYAPTVWHNQHPNQPTNNISNMKSIIISLLSIASLGLLPSCTTVESRPPAVQSSTTTTSEVSPTTYGTVQTKTTRTY